MKRTYLIRVVSTLLALLMAGSMLLACADEKKPDNPDNPNQPENPEDPDDKTPDEEEDPYNVADSLPDVNYGGREFNILYYTDAQLPYFYVSEKTGNLIDDAVFSSISATEERFGVDIDVIQAPSDSETAYATFVSTQIQSGITDFDIANMHDVNGGNLSIQGMFLNILDMDQFDFSKPWWSEKVIKSLSFMDQLYLISSSITYGGLGSPFCMFFNMQLLDDYGIEYPYQDVLDRNWYLEDVLSMTEDCYQDTNGNGKDDQDIYGVLMRKEFYAQFESFGINLIEKSADNTELILNSSDPRAYDLIDMFYYALYECDSGFAAAADPVTEMFKNSQGAFIMTNVGQAVTGFRNVNFKYGIVPYPMLDAEQDDYYAGYTARFMVIPNTCDDTDFVATMIEAMSAEAYRQVTPAYYETALKGRYTHDSESVQMLEIIRNAAVIDFAYIYSNDTAGSRALAKLVAKKNKDYASFIKQLESSAYERIDLLTEWFASMAD